MYDGPRAKNECGDSQTQGKIRNECEGLGCTKKRDEMGGSPAVYETGLRQNLMIPFEGLAANDEI
jgi:hypothetical protein